MSEKSLTDVEFTAGVKITSGVPGAGKVFTSDPDGNGTWQVAGAGTVTGSGTTGKIPKWTGSSALGDSIMSESGTVITVAGTLAATTLTGAGSGITDLNAGNLASGTLPAARFNDTAHGVRSGATLHSAVTITVNGFMTAADKVKLNGIATSANNYTLPVATGSVIGGVQGGPDITIDGSGEMTIVDDSHNHVIGNVDGLQDALDGKASTSHTHVVSAITGIATDSFLGRDTAGTGTGEVLSASQARTILNVADGANNYTLPVATGSVIGGVQGGPDITIDGSGEMTIVDDSHNHVISNVDGLQDALDGKASSSHTHVVSAITGIATNSFLGRDTAGTGTGEVLSASQARTILNVADGANNYSHPNHSGDVTSVGDGALTIASNAVTFAKMQNINTARIMGRVTEATGDPEELTAAQVRTLINVADGANNYTLPVATASVIGGVQGGSDITINGSGEMTIVDDSHNHVIGNVDGLQSALDGKVAIGTLTSEGDIFYRNGSTVVRLAKGTDGHVLTAGASTISWAAPAASGHTIQDEGNVLADESVLDFQGIGVTATAGSGKTIVTIDGISYERVELVATAGQSVFVFTALTNDLIDDPALSLIYFNGKLVQDGLGNDYDVTGAKEITADPTEYPGGLVAGDKVWVLALSSLSQLVSSTPATMTRRAYVFGTASGDNYDGTKTVLLENGDSYPNTGHFLKIYQNGVKLILGSDYTEDATNQFTIVAGRTVLDGDIIEAIWIGVTGSLGTQTEERYDEVVTGSSKQVFTPGFTFNTGGKSVFVLFDGVLKRSGVGNDYTETGGGTTITTQTPRVVGTLVTIYTRLQGSAGNADTVDGFHAQAFFDLIDEAELLAMLF